MSPEEEQRLLAAFENFDRAFNDELTTAPPEDFEASIPRLKAVIDQLPQRAVIQDQHADRWLERTLSMAVSRMELEHGEGKASVRDVHEHVMWHIRRASGFGGSEVGTLAKHFENKKGNFTNAHNLVLEKLLIMSPQPSTPEMARGVRAEPWIQKIYHDKTGFRSDLESLHKLRGFRWSRAPFLAGTPDDIVLTGDEGKRKVVDYKAPSADVCAGYEAHGISEDYVCQLHHYAVISMAAGVRFEDMSIEVLDPRSFDVVSYPVPFDKELARNIINCSRILWEDFVMQGLVPDAPKVDDLDVEDPVLISLGHEAAMFRALKDTMGQREKDCLERIALIGADMHEKATGKLALGVADYTRKRIWDQESLVNLAVAAGIDIETHRKEGKKPDMDQVSEFLNSLLEELRKEDGDPSGLLEDFARDGIPMDRPIDLDALAESVEAAGIDTIEAAGVHGSFGLSRKKKGPEAESVGRLRDKVSELAEALDEVVHQNAGAIIRGEPEEPEVLPDME